MFGSCVAVASLKQECVRLDEGARKELLHFLVSLREKQWAEHANAASKPLDDPDQPRWLTATDFKTRLDRIPEPPRRVTRRFLIDSDVLDFVGRLNKCDRAPAFARVELIRRPAIGHADFQVQDEAGREYDGHIAGRFCNVFWDDFPDRHLRIMRVYRADRAPQQPCKGLRPVVKLLRAMQIESFTGGIFDTNAFFLPEHGILIDAPQDAAGWLRSRGHRVTTLLLTHGHIDHVWEAGQIQREHGCRVVYHAETEPMITEAGFFRQFGYAWEIDTVAADWVLPEGARQEVGGVLWDVLLVPGHCPGSLCFHSVEEKLVFGGDVLFAGGVGRWDLPGGDRELLMAGIRGKLLPLGDDVQVLSGHGPATTMGVERRGNPFLMEG